MNKAFSPSSNPKVDLEGKQGDYINPFPPDHWIIARMWKLISPWKQCVTTANLRQI
jgi:hypothetical protein